LIQAIMYIALGLLIAGLLMLVVTPAIWRRAMRLARARIESAAPMTRTEISAEKDQLRAEFAVANRRLEMDLGRLTDKLSEQVVEANRRRDEVVTLNRQRNELTRKVGDLERRITELTAALGDRGETLTRLQNEIARRDDQLAAQAAAIRSIEATLADSEQKGEEQRLELVARDTTIANLTDRLAASIAAEAATMTARDALAAELGSERQRLAAETKRADGLEAGLAVLRNERTERQAELDRRASELQALRAEIAAAQVGREVAAVEAAAEHVAAVGGDNVQKAIAAVEAVGQTLATRLAAVVVELATLRAENTELRSVAGPEWESDRRENRQLRERLNEIATNVVRLTQTMAASNPSLTVVGEDGNGAGHPQPPGDGQKTAPAGPPTAPGIAEKPNDG
jgi:chromosome segregation ATPase